MRKQRPACASCYSKNVSYAYFAKRTKLDTWRCNLCKHYFRGDTVRIQKEKAKSGSGVIAGPLYRSGYAGWRWK